MQKKQTGFCGPLTRSTVLASAIAVACAASAQVTIYTDEPTFDTDATTAGLSSQGIWGLQNTQGPSAIISFSDPLNFTFPGPYTPGDMLDDLTFQANFSPFGVPAPNPRGPIALVLVNAPTFIPVDSVVANYFVDSFDIISEVPEPEHVGMKMEVTSLFGDGVTVTVFDEFDNILGQQAVVGSNTQSAFLGIIADPGVTIGRVNLYDPSDGAEGVAAFIEVFEALEIEVAIDIKFCSNPNGFNCKSRGATPVTIFGTVDFDVNDINVSTAMLCLADDLDTCTALAPKDSSVADRGDPTTDIGASQCAIDEDFLNPDGFDDLDVAFYTQDVVSVIGCGALSKGDASPTLVLIGETTGGTPITSVPVDDVGVDQLLIQKN